MKHQKIDELGAVAEIVPFEIAKKMSRRERLERWADVLDQNPGKLNALTRIEYLTRAERPRGAGRQLAAGGGVQGSGAAARTGLPATVSATPWRSSSCRTAMPTGCSATATIPAA